MLLSLPLWLTSSLRACSRRSLRLRFVSDAVEQAYLRASARQSGWGAFWAVAAALALSSAGLAVGFHQLFAAAGASVLPLPVVLAAVEAALAVALGALGARRACVTRARGACGSTHWLWGAVPLLLGCSIVVAEDIWAPGPGYLHAQLWLLPLAAFFGGGLGWAVRFEHAAPGAWIPLLLYLGKTAGACERGDCYVPGMLDARHDGTPQLPMVAYFATLLVFTASATAAAWRAERSHRDAYVACRQTQLERSEIKMEDGRVRQLLGQALPYPLVCNLKDIAGARGTVDQQPQLTSLHHLPSVSILVVDVVAADACTNLSAAEVAGIWNAVFAVIDGAVESVGCEKLGTVGWRYLAAAGLYASNTGETLAFLFPAHIGWRIMGAVRRACRASGRLCGVRAISYQRLLRAPRTSTGERLSSRNSQRRGRLRCPRSWPRTGPLRRLRRDCEHSCTHGGVCRCQQHCRFQRHSWAPEEQLFD